MGHSNIVRVVGLVGCTLIAITRRRTGRLSRGALAVMSAGLGLWALGLALSFAGI
jgi:hypothetical protein